MRKQITSKNCGECHGPYALGVEMGNIIFTSQVGTDKDGNVVEGGVKAQTKQIMENAIDVLSAAGATLDDVGKVTIYITDMSIIGDMNEVYATYFKEGDFPARCCTQCSGMADGCCVEMEFVAIKC